MNEDNLHERWLSALEAWERTQPLPPCPNCEGEMEPWDCWLVTGETCKACGWSSSEGFGTI